jgi:hypothetical protein
MSRIADDILGLANEARRILHTIAVRKLILFLFLVCNIFACTPVPPKVIEISKVQTFRPSTPDEVKDINQAMAAVITAATDLGLPKVDSLSLWLYPSTESFAYWGRREADIAKLEGISASTDGLGIHINIEAMHGRPWGGLISLLAHEYGHLVHNAFGGPGVPRWFREGFAEWVSSRILDSLAWRSGDVAIRRAKLEISAQGEFNTSVFQDEKSWTSRMGKPGRFAGTYTAAFLGVDRLIRKNGFPAAIEYFKTAQFESSFHQSYASFEQEFQNSISDRDRRTQHTTLEVDKPEWNVGFRWEYQITKSGKTEQSMQEVHGIDTSAQLPVYVLREKKEERLYRVDSLGLLETRVDGIIKTRRYKSNELFAWPLQLKKEWRNRYKLESMDLNRTITMDRKMIVSGVEKVKVPAGTFEAIKIEAYDYNSGRLSSEYWFSPKVKWYVKTLRYEGQDTYFTEEQLTAFKLK